MISRRSFLTITSLGILATPLVGEAQQAGRTHRIGYFSWEPAPTPEVPAIGLQALRQALRRLGYEEGRNVVIVYRWAGFDPDQIRPSVAELVEERVDVIVTYSTGMVLRAKAVTTTIPIVCALCADLVGGGAVASLARPGGNVTGLTVIGPELAGKRIEFLRDLGASRVLGLHTAPPDFPVVARWRRENDQAAQALGITFEGVHARDLPAIENALARAATQPSAGVSFMEEPRYLVDRRRIAALAVKHRLPTVFPFAEHVTAGGLLAYGVNVSELFAKSADYVDRILKGAKPGDLPVEQPTKFELVINAKTAKTLGLTIPPSLLARADQVIE